MKGLPDGEGVTEVGGVADGRAFEETGAAVLARADNHKGIVFEAEEGVVVGYGGGAALMVGVDGVEGGATAGEAHDTADKLLFEGHALIVAGGVVREEGTFTPGEGSLGGPAEHGCWSTFLDLDLNLIYRRRVHLFAPF